MRQLQKALFDLAAELAVSNISATLEVDSSCSMAAPLNLLNSLNAVVTCVAIVPVRGDEQPLIRETHETKVGTLHVRCVRKRQALHEEKVQIEAADLTQTDLVRNEYYEVKL